MAAPSGGRERVPEHVGLRRGTVATWRAWAKIAFTIAVFTTAFLLSHCRGRLQERIAVSRRWSALH
eukprot:369479-Pyramimonas_sp.AAC.2